MTAGMGLAIIGLLSVIVNYITLYMIFPCRHSKRLSISLAVLFVAAFYSLLIFTGLVTTTFYGLRGFIHLPMIIFLFRGQFFQKTFATFFAMVLSGMQIYPARAIAAFFAPAGSSEYYFLFIVVLSAMYLIYLFLMFKFGRHIFDKMFITGRKSEWGIYSLGSLFSIVIMAFLQSVSIPVWVNMTLLVFILWSFGVLCYAIINTHEKSKQQYEADFARDIVSSGHDHYQKTNELRDTLRAMRHDYKYHLSAARQMLRSGDVAEADDYLSDIEARLSENELPDFCANTVINALLASYTERCAKQDIRCDMKIVLPDPLTISNYDMCIVLGNLLENAVEACEKQEQARVIELQVKPHETQLIIKVKNTFDGKLARDARQPVGSNLPLSVKKDGGIGLRSVQAVTARYDGELITEWDAEAFTAYVYLRLQCAPEKGSYAF